MKTKLLFISLLLIFVLAACGPAAETAPAPSDTAPEGEGALEINPEPAATAEPAESNQSEQPAPPTVPPLPESDSGPGYPPQPTIPATPESYPPPAAPAATVNPYPEAVDGFIWMLLPVGIQCEDDARLYNDLTDAVAGLTAVNVQTGQAETTELTVCTACGCPTSAHYRVQVSVEDVIAAQSLGWTREQ